jgi:hypothetical protein
MANGEAHTSVSEAAFFSPPTRRVVDFTKDAGWKLRAAIGFGNNGERVFEPVGEGAN